MKSIVTSVVQFCIILLIAFTLKLQAQDNPNFDNTFGMDIPESQHVQSPSGRIAVVDETGFDNFFLGVDFAEPHMSTNPNNPTEYFNAFNTNDVHYSYNGHDWILQIPAFGFNMQGDPVTAYDSLGNLYYENMYGTAGIEGCKVIRSTDNGATWTTAVTSISGVDKNWIAADQTSGPYANFVYTTMTAGGGVGRFSRSTDFGATWQNTFSPSTQSLPGMMVCVGPNTVGGDVPGGAVYVVTNSGSSFAATFSFYLSTDGGATFNLKSQQQFANYVGTNVGGRNSVENMRTRPYPFITADNSYGTYRGRLYLIYASNTPVGNGNKPDIFCRYSTNQGVSWSSPVVINDDANTTSHHQWHPSTWCDKETGRLYVKWFDTRNVPTSDSAEVYASYSDNGGITWAPNQNLSTAKFKIDCSTCGGGGTPRYEGDYDAITSNKFSSLAVWSDFRTGSFGSYVAYFPDFAMTISAVSDTIRPDGSLDVVVKVPAIKLYEHSVKFSGSVSPSANFQFVFPNGDSLTSFPDSLVVQIKPNNAPSNQYVVTITGEGPNGTPVHKREINLLVTSPTTTVLNPNGGDVLYVGTEYPIEWENIFVDSVNLEYSTDGGSNWNLIVEGARPDNISNNSITNSQGNNYDNPQLSNQYMWLVPNQLSDNCLIRATDAGDPSVQDVSDSVFSITTSPQPGWRVLSSGTDSVFLCVDVVDSVYAWAGTKGGKVLRTTDGGNSWTTLSTNQGGDVTSIDAVDDRVAFIIVNSPTFTRIRRTIAFGQVWSTVYEDTDPDAHLNAIKMFDETNGYSIGNPVNGMWTLLKTTDQGVNWNDASSLPQNGSETGWNNSMDWTDNMHSWFGTDNNRVYRTTDGGLNWTSSSTNLTNSMTVSFSGEFNGLASGDATDRTLDGGLNWVVASEQIPGTVVSSAGIKNSEGRIYLVSGQDIYQTNNYGDTYTVDFTQSENINNLDMDIVSIGVNKWIIGYAAGDNGSIAKYVELVTVSEAENENSSLPESFSLKQNYPNPFNPTTNIEFSLPVSSDVKLNVFNILGQEVSTLLNQEMSAGNHTVVWNALDNSGRKLSSGIYFYMLKAKAGSNNEFQEIKKMILLK